MPRRNRNAHALAPDIDQLADQARQLTTELCPPILVPDTASNIPGNPGTIREALTTWATRHLVSAAAAKAVTPDVQ